MDAVVGSTCPQPDDSCTPDSLALVSGPPSRPLTMRGAWAEVFCRSFSGRSCPRRPGNAPALVSHSSPPVVYVSIPLLARDLPTYRKAALPVNEDEVPTQYLHTPPRPPARLAACLARSLPSPTSPVASIQPSFPLPYFIPNPPPYRAIDQSPSCAARVGCSGVLGCWVARGV